MSLLPGRILPQTEKFGTTDSNGDVTIEKNWWLLLYNLCQQTLGTGAGLPADALIDLESADADAIDSDAIALRQPIANLAVDSPDLGGTVDLVPALLLAQDGLLADPIATAQPSAAISPSGSPFTYTAPFNGSVIVTAGSVSDIAIVRQGTSIETGVTVGQFMLSRLDQLVVTYSMAPTMTFLPT